MAVQPQFDWAGVIAQALGGLGNGIQDVQRQQTLRTEADQRQQGIDINKAQFGLQQKQEERIAGQSDLNNLIQRLQMLDPETEAGPDLIGEAAKHGLAGMFYKDPATGVFKRRRTESEQIKLAEAKANAATAGVHQQQATMELAQQKELMDPTLASRLMAMPVEQRSVFMLQHGMKGDAPMSLDEQRQQAMVNPSVISAGIYANRQQNQGNNPKAVTTLAQQLWNKANPGQMGMKPALTMESLAPFLEQAQKMLNGDFSQPEAPPTPAPAPEKPSMFAHPLQALSNWWNGAPNQVATPQTGITLSLTELQQQAQEDGVPVEQLIGEAKQRGITITR